jgi:hypothetical protein
MEMIPQNTVWLLPEEAAPCNLYLYFRGKYIQGVAANSPVPFAFLEKITQAKLKTIYIHNDDLPTWLNWQLQRHQDGDKHSPKSKDPTQTTNNKRPELFSYLRKTFTAKNEGDKKVVGSLEKAFVSIQEAANSSLLDWYFQQFHEPPNLLFHNGRVALLSLYISHYFALLSDDENKNLAISTLVHELEGDPASPQKSITSELTLKKLESAKRPFPKEIVQLIQVQDEFCDGTGFPKGLSASDLKETTKLFSIANQFDHIRLREGGTRKSRYDRTKQKLTKEQSHFDTSLLQKFFECCETHLEIV